MQLNEDQAAALLQVAQDACWLLDHWTIGHIRMETYRDHTGLMMFPKELERLARSAAEAIDKCGVDSKLQTEILARHAEFKRIRDSEIDSTIAQERSKCES